MADCRPEHGGVTDSESQHQRHVGQNGAAGLDKARRRSGLDARRRLVPLNRHIDDRVVGRNRRNRVGVVGVEDLSWRLAAAADPEVSSHLVDRYLTPLREQGEFGKVLEDTVRAYLGNGQNVARAAAYLNVHGNTLRYRLEKFTDLTGATLMSTDTVIEVAWALELGSCDLEPTTSLVGAGQLTAWRH